MKHTLAILIILQFVFFTFSACTNKVPNSQTPEVSDSVKSQTQQPILTTSNSPSIIKETQQNIDDSNAITKSEVQSFFNSDNEFATNMLQYPALDMSNLEEVMAMILYPLGASEDHPVSFSDFNKYAKKYINRTYADSDFEKYATDENGVEGTNVVMSKKNMYISGIGGTELLIKNIEIVGSDSELLTCSRGLGEPDTMEELSFKVQFGKANSQLYFKSISRLGEQARFDTWGRDTAALKSRN